MNILYLPIIEPGDNHAVALANKRGLYDALLAAGHAVYQWDYLDTPHDQMEAKLAELVVELSPDLLLTQIHGADCFSPQSLAALRSQFPNMRIVNWSGDSWLHSLTSDAMIDLCRQFDLQLIAAPDVLPVYAEKGIRAKFWQIAWEPSIGELPDVPEYDVVFLGNVINDKRRAMLEMLRTLPYKVGIYGDWEHADGRCTYNFAMGEALYKKAKLAIADNVYQDQSNYMSNRPIQIAMAHGALLLHQHIDKMEELSYGWVAGRHYYSWYTLDDLKSDIEEFMKLDWSSRAGALRMIDTIYLHSVVKHTYAARVYELMEWLE